MFLTDENLSIRNAEMNDAKLLCRWWNDGKVMAHAGFPNGVNTTIQKVKQKLLNDSDETGRRLILEIDGKPVGEMNYNNQGNGVAQIGIKICESDYQNKGAGTRFLRMLIKHLFDEMSYEKIMLDTNVKNTRAQYVYEKLGFRKVRVNHDAWRNQLGELQSSIDYELLYSDFETFEI